MHEISLNNFSQLILRFCETEKIDLMDIILLGGTALHIKNIRNHRDLDICVLSDIQRQLLEKYQNTPIVKILPNKTIKYSDLIDINKGNVLKKIDITDEELITNHKYFDVYKNIKVIKLEIIYSKKLYRVTNIHNFRFKDLYDVFLIHKYFKSNKNIDKELLIFQRNFLSKFLSKLAIIMSYFYSSLPKSMNKYKVKK